MTKRLKDQGRRPPRVVGLDAHPDSFTGAVVEGSVPLEARVVHVSDKVPLPRLESWVDKNTEKQDVLVIESSANTFELVDRLEQIGRSVLVLDSVRVGKIGKQYCRNDRVSAVKIARVYLTGLSEKVWVPDERTRQRREILSAHSQAKGDYTRSVNRFRGYLNEYTIRLPRGSSLVAEKTLEHILARREWSPLQQDLLREAFEDIQRAAAKRKRLEQVMARDILKDPDLLRLVRIYGLRHISVYALAACIGNIRRFRSPKKLVAYVGVNPRVDESGNTRKGSELAGNGRKDLRGIVIEAAQCIFKHESKSNRLYRWAWKLSYRRGRNRAVVAVARKLVTAAWYCMMGLFTPLQEADKTLREKIRKLCQSVGINELRAEGYKTYQQAVEEKIGILSTVT